MASYTPLESHELDNVDEPSGCVKEPFIGGRSLEADRVSSRIASRWTDWVILILSVFALATSASLYASSLASTPPTATGLRRPDPRPGLDKSVELAEGPIMLFPTSIVRVNRAHPDKVYTTSSHVVLSTTDSMFYQFRLPSRMNVFLSCYIDAVVPTPEDGLAANKTYISSGDLAEIQVWNVSGPPTLFSNLSWNTRPERIARLGTVAFMPEKERMAMLELEDGWQLKPPTPRFACEPHTMYTIEVACDDCTLEFEQLFSDPPLAFDVLQLG